MIDRTDRDPEAKKGRRETTDDAHADHSLDPNEHYGQESDIPADDELRDGAETEG